MPDPSAGTRRVAWFVRCPDDSPGITCTGAFDTEAEAEASRAEIEEMFNHCSGPHTVESRDIADEGETNG